MRLNEYQQQAMKTAIYPHHGEQQLGGITYTVLGLAGEAGELSNGLKKVLRDKGGVIDFYDQQRLAEECADVIWYCAALCTELDLTLEEVARKGLAKLASRQQRQVLGGSGDAR